MTKPTRFARAGVCSPKLTVGFSQPSYILITYRVVGAGAPVRVLPADGEKELLAKGAH